MKKAISKYRCMDCKFAYLMQSRQENPIIAECQQPIKNKERFVAESWKICNMYEKRMQLQEIHPMKLPDYIQKM